VSQFYIPNEECKNAERYWLSKLSGELPKIKIPYCNKLKPVEKSEETQSIVLEKEIEDRLLIITKNNDLLLYVYLLSVFKIMLYKLSGIKDVCVSSPVYIGQSHVQLHMYNKFIYLRDYLDYNISFKYLLKKVKQTVIDGYKYQYYPMDRLKELLMYEQSTDYEHNICFYFMNIHGNECLDEMIKSKSYHFIFYIEKQESLKVKIVFNNQVMDELFAAKLIAGYKNILLQTMSDINLRISSIRLVNEDEIQILNQFNNTCVDFGKVKTLSKWFEEQEIKCSDKIAVTYVKEHDEYCEHLTYKELNIRANQLAYTLKKNGAARGEIIGLIVRNSLDIAVGILGILKAGGAYLPIDPDYPLERIQYMIRDSNMKLLVTNRSLSDISSFQGIVISLSNQVFIKEGTLNLNLESSPDDPAYLIYTSGSTGKPKGTIVTHKNLFNYVKWRIDALAHSSEDVSLQLLSIGFDGFGSNFYPALLSGGRIVFVDNAYWRNQDYICRVIANQKITNFSLVPPLYKMILMNAPSTLLDSLRFVVLAGEKSDASLITLSYQKFPKLMLVNEYGPTETTIAVTSLIGIDAVNTSIIGRPIANNKVYILDKDNQLLPIGLFGELCVAGEGVSMGYHEREELTKDKFISNVLPKSEVLYKTGDIARWREDGTIEILGRLDSQVKVMGCRIEPGEIESVISSYNGITQAVVTVIENETGYTQLSAFFTATSKISIEQLRIYLSSILPTYMIPLQIIQLSEFPLSINSKINISALKLISSDETANKYTIPDNDIEKVLTGIWEQVLEKDKIGTSDNFFEMGGNSFLVMQVHSLIEKVYPGVTKIPDLFAYPSISKLSEYIGRHKSKLK